MASPTFQTTHDPGYADFGQGRFNLISGSKMHRIRAYAGQSVLDVGCGPGAYLAALKAAGYTVAGVDGNAAMVAQAVQQGLAVAQLDLDREGLRPIADNAYDTVLSLDVLEHLQNPQTVLAEMVRVCRLNVLVSVPAQTPPAVTTAGLLYAAWQDPTHLRYYTPQALQHDLETAGLTKVTIYPTFAVPPLIVGFFPKPYQPLMRLLNRILSRLLLPQCNWSVLLGVGHKA